MSQGILMQSKHPGEKGKARYIVIEGASQRGNSLLVDRIGYRYNIGKVRKCGNVSWVCQIRNRNKRCPAAVLQAGDLFLPNHKKHNHPKEPDAELKARISAGVQARVSEDSVTPVEIVENVLLSQDTSKVRVLPDPEAIVRRVKRKRLKARLLESENHEVIENVADTPVQQSRHQYKESPEVKFSLIEGASQRGNSLLVDNMGYKYNVSKLGKGKVFWCCAVRKNHAKCPVRVKQEGDSFIPNQMNHNHIAEPGTALKARIVAEAKAKALEDSVSTAREILKKVVSCLDANKAKELPIPKSILRYINKKRQKLRESKRENHEDMVDVADDISPQSIVQCSKSGVVQYSVIEGDSKRGKSLLIDGNGNEYNIKRSYPSGKVLWKCKVQNDVICPATVQQNGDEFLPSQAGHNHSAQPKEQVCEDNVTSAQKMSSAEKLPDANSVIRQDFRKRQKVKQFEAENHRLTKCVVKSTLQPSAKQGREAPAVSYSVMEGTSKRGNSLLLDSNGHTYSVIKSYPSGKVLWGCTIRNKKVKCGASVLQNLDSFKPNLKKHDHFAPLGTELNI